MQYGIGLALVVLQAALMGLLSRNIQFPILAVLVAAFGAFTKWRIPLSREQAFLVSAGAAFFFMLKHRFSPQDFPVGTEFIRTEIAFLIAQFLLFIEAGLFVVRREEDHLSPVLPALGVVALICIADVQITNEQRGMTLAFAVAYTVLWAAYLWAGRRPMKVPASSDPEQQARRRKAGRRRRSAAVLVLGMMAATAWVGSLGLFEIEKKIESWLLELMSGSNANTTVGFSRSSRLGSLAHQKSQAEQEVAVWVYADQFPGYLRGAVFSEFDSSIWSSNGVLKDRQISEKPGSPQGMRPLAGKEVLHAHPEMTAGTASQWRYLECWLAAENEFAAFVPLGTTHLISAADRIRFLPGGVFGLYDIEESNPYTACVPENYSTWNAISGKEAGYLQVPEKYQKALGELAQQVFANASTEAEKIAAAESYFQDNFAYHLEIDIPPGEDPLLYFLREKPAAHCEYFATASALLLRTANVPARYVTGFVPAEWNPTGGYWAARNRDAHAWVEAYVEGQGWVTVEATPAEGVPSTDQSAAGNAWWEAIRSDWRRLRAFLSQNRWNRAWSLLRSSWLGAMAGLFSLAFAAYLAVRIPWPWPRPGRKNMFLDPQLVEMQQMLAKMDRQLRAHGLERSSGETLHHFAQRIQNWKQWRKAPASEETSRARYADLAAEWYHLYAHARYQGKWDSDTLEVLRSRWPDG